MKMYFGQVAVSAVVLGVWAAHMMGVGISLGEGDVKIMDTCLTLTVGYWLGSSHGSLVKTMQGDKP